MSTTSGTDTDCCGDPGLGNDNVPYGTRVSPRVQLEVHAVAREPGGGTGSARLGMPLSGSTTVV